MQLYSYKLSALEWNPVGFDVIGSSFKLKNTPMAFSNGMFFNVYNFLSGVNDLTFNNKTGMILTGGVRENLSIIEDSETQKTKSPLKKIISSITDINDNIYKHYSIFGSISGLQSKQEQESLVDRFTFTFENDYVIVEDFFGKILTNGGIGIDQTTLSTKTSPLNNYQKWKYLLGDNLICLFAYDAEYDKILIVDSVTKKLTLVPFNGINANVVSSDSFLLFKSLYKQSQIIKNTNIINSFIVDYDANPTLDEKNLKIFDKKDLPYQNFLGLFPYEYLKSNGNYDFCFHGLKNYQNAEYEYSSELVNRKYYRIYSGTKQTKGNDKISLNYISNTLSINFQTGKKTDFYVSSTMESIPLNESSLVDDGATPGQYPYTSDRIYVKRDSNFAEIPQLQKIIKKAFDKDNQYLCSWLYGSRSTGEAVWFDRYYNAAKYSQNEALSFTYMSYQNKLDVKKDYVYDVPSEITLTPGYLYSYYHVGNQDAKTFLKDLDLTLSKDETTVNSNVLNVTSWGNTLYDNSVYKNNGLIFGTSAAGFKNYWELDGTNYAVFQATSSLLPEKNLTVSMWLNFNDWSNINAYQIFGNFYESGFGLINENKSTSPLFTMIDTQSDFVYNFNYQLSEVSKLKTELSDGDMVQRLADLSYWVFDSKNAEAIKYNVNNSIISLDEDGVFGKIKLSLSKIDQVEIDSMENLYIYDNTQKQYVVLNKDGFAIGGSKTATYSNRIEIDLYDAVLDGVNDSRVVYGNCSVIDNDNSLWQIIGPNLYKNDVMIGTVGASNYITCDVYNNIWIINSDDEYSKFDNDGNFIFRYSFNKTPLLNETICPPSPPALPPTIKVLDEDLPFLSTNDYKYILTIPDYYQILVTPPKPKRKPIIEDYRRHRAIDFISSPQLKQINENLLSVCGLSATDTDQMIMLDMSDNQLYVINQAGQLRLKLNLEILAEGDNKVSFKTFGDFTGYQYNRKFKNIKSSNLSWKYQVALPDLTVEYTDVLNCDVSDLTSGWHHICFTLSLDQKNNFRESRFYIDSVLKDSKIYTNPVDQIIYYKYRTSLILGATTIKNTLLNNVLNLKDGYKMVGSVSDLKIYNYAISPQDVEQLYYGSDFSPKLKDLKWRMPVGDRNYVEEISEWFKFQMPTNKSKFYNINIHNLNVDENVKDIIQNAISNIIGKITPSHTSLNKINWIDKDKNTRKNLPTTKEIIKPFFGNSIYVGFGAATNEFTSDQHWIHDFQWFSILQDYDINKFLINSNIYGNAKIIGSSFRLTDGEVKKFGDDIYYNVKSVGNVYYNKPNLIYDDFNKGIEWVCYFKFSMGGPAGRSKGLSFIIGSDPVQTSIAGNGFGYEEIKKSTGIIFDHKSIYIYANGDVDNIIAKGNVDFDMRGSTSTERMVHTWVEYSLISKVINVFVSLESQRPAVANLSFPLDIRKYVDVSASKTKSNKGFLNTI